jgi:DNA-dependent metalloprotease WSS1
MAKRKWSVPVVSEFYPAQSNLLGLNVNGGEAIKIRLRRASSKTAFYPYESILHTLLHELTHIERGPHDATFYKLLDELVVEAERLPAVGASGSPTVIGAGKRLDGARPVPRRQAASAAAKAAESRLRKQSIMGSGRLGGDQHGLAGVCTPAELAAAAAERRRKDDIWCPSGGAGASRPGAARSASGGESARDDDVIVVDLEADEDSRRQLDGGGGGEDDVIVLD